MTQDEIVEIDIQMEKDRKIVYLFFRELPSNSKCKAKRVIVVITLASGFWFRNLKSEEAIDLPIPLSPVVRVQSSYQNDSYQSNE